MQRFKHSLERSSHDVPTTEPSGVPYGRTLSHRHYVHLGRQHRSGDLAARRPPYIEVAVTAVVFLFLLILIFGGI
jgi:hypothetical protein